MKRGDRLANFARGFARPPTYRPAHLWLLAVPTLGWYAAHRSRPELMSLHCLQNPDLCSAASVPSIDRIAIGSVNGSADSWSFFTQYLAGALAIALPIVWNMARRRGWLVFFRSLCTDWAIAVEVTLWNGLAMETTRLVVQRPRPFVFENPGAFGGNPAHYTSFYSGHTSFAAAAGMATILFLVGRGASSRTATAFAAVALVVTALTGWLRVAAGRHFPTDVIAGAVAGVLVALVIRSLHREPGVRLS